MQYVSLALTTSSPAPATPPATNDKLRAGTWHVYSDPENIDCLSLRCSSEYAVTSHILVILRDIFHQVYLCFIGTIVTIAVSQIILCKAA